MSQGDTPFKEWAKTTDGAEKRNLSRGLSPTKPLCLMHVFNKLEEKKGHTPVVGFEWWGCLRSLGAAGTRKRGLEQATDEMK